MTTYQFEIKEHPEFGDKGLAPRWYPNGDPLGGMAAAHDILEHFPGDKGDTEGELMALGASLYVRADGCYMHAMGKGFTRAFDELRDVPSDFPMIWDYHNERERGREIKRPPRVSLDVHERIAPIVHEIRKLMKSERDGDPDRYGTARTWTREDYKRIQGWLGRGYQMAKRRYRRTPAWKVARLFSDIEQACDRAIKHGKEGQLVHVRVKVIAGTAHVRRTWEDGSEPYED